MQISKREGNLNGVEFGFRLRESSLLREMLEELPSLNEVHNEVDAVGSLEHKIYPYDEGVVDLKLYQFFDNKIFDRLLFYHNVLTYAFHRVKRFEASALN